SSRPGGAGPRGLRTIPLAADNCSEREVAAEEAGPRSRARGSRESRGPIRRSPFSMRRSFAMSVLALAVMVGTIAAMAATASASTAADIQMEMDVSWRTVGDLTIQADFYWPSSGCPCPGIVELHGGGFTTGTRDWNTGESITLAQNGYYVMNTDYQLNVGTVPALDDAIAAVAYLATRPGVDPTRIGAHGSSAGAILATGLAIKGSTVGVVGAVSWSGGT